MDAQCIALRDELQTLQQRHRQCGRRGGGIDVAARLIDECVDDDLFCRDKSTGDTCRLAQRAHQNDTRGSQAKMRQTAPTPLAQHAEAVRIVHQQPGIVSFAQRQQLRQGRDVAVHAEHGIGDNQFPAFRRLHQQLFELRHVAMPIALHLRARQQHGIVERGMVELVGKHGVALARQRLHHTEVGHETGGKQ